MKRVFSGIQPTGELHIGNYLGAIRNWVKLIDSYETIFCIVDYHSMTIKYDPREMKKRVLNVAIDLMACGLDISKTTLFVQSMVIEHTELCWIFNTITPVGYLNRMTQFKDKSSQHPENINAGLYDYPVLQAADILLYKAELVPVGEDQVQHIELSRDIARFFNNTFGKYFPEPEALISPAARVMGLDGKNKMSKSLGNYISLRDSKETLEQKILRRAVTDENRKRRSDPGNPDICNVFSYHKFFSSQEDIDEIREGCQKATIGCVDCKKKLIANMEKTLAPIRENINKLSKDESYIWDVLWEGGKKSKEVAMQTMEDVRKLCGIYYK